MVFSLRRLLEKCREQNQPLYLAFIDLTKAFDLVSRDSLFKMLPDSLALWAPWRYDVYCTVWWWYVFRVQSQEWCQAGLCTFANPAWHLFRFAVKTCLQVINRWCIPPLQIRWSPLQHLKIPCQDQDQDSHNQRPAVFRWCSHGISPARWAPETIGQVPRCLRSFRSHNQPKEDPGYGLLFA